MSPFSASASSTASMDSSWPQLIFRLKSAMAAETTQSASRSGSVEKALEGHSKRHSFLQWASPKIYIFSYSFLFLC